MIDLMKNCHIISQFRICAALLFSMVLSWPTMGQTLELKPQEWTLPTPFNSDGMARVAKSTGYNRSVHLYLAANAPVLAPSDGVLLYKGPFGPFETGHILEHSSGLISLIYNAFEWETTADLKPGQSIKKGQLLSTMRAGGPGRTERLLNWEVFRLGDAEKAELKNRIRKLETTSTERPHELITWLNKNQFFDIKKALQWGTFELGQDFESVNDRSAVTSTLGQDQRATDIHWDYGYLMPAGWYTFTITSGQFFKSTFKTPTLISAGGTLINSIQKKANGDFALSKSTFRPSDNDTPMLLPGQALTLEATDQASPQGLPPSNAAATREQPSTQPLLSPASWSLPTSFNMDGMVPIAKSSGHQAGLQFFLPSNADVLAPADGILLYKGSFGPFQFETGHLIEHAPGLLSLLINVSLNFENNTALSEGMPLKKGEFISKVGGKNFSLPSQLVRWQVFQLSDSESVELKRRLVRDKPNDPYPSQISETIAWLQTKSQISTQSKLKLGAFELAQDFASRRDTNSFTVERINGSTSVPLQWDYAYLMPEGNYTFSISSGRVFKTESKINTFITPGDTVTHFVRKLPNGDFAFGRHDVQTAEVPLAASPSALPATVAMTAETPVAATPSIERGASASLQGASTAPAVLTAPAPAPSPAASSTPSASPISTNAPLGIAGKIPPGESANSVVPMQVDNRVQIAQAEAQALRQEVARQRLMLEQMAQAQAVKPSVSSPQTQPANTAPPLSTRRALVIGNDTYQSVPKLLNAREDAQAMARSLREMGFQVQLELDLRERDMKAALRQFKSRVEGGDEVIIFYAGHGVQLAGTNYLLPVDISGENEEQIRDESIQLQRILDDMTEKRAKFTLAMLDACRDNPFKGSGRAIGGRGLAPTSAATGQMVIFSAGTGQQALDKLGPNDQEKNGLFTRVFLKEMQKPGISIDRIVRNVRSEVVTLAKSVGHEQVPAIYDQVVGEYFLKR